MTDAWDFMIAGSDAEVSAEIGADAIAYGKLLAAGDERGCLAIEEKYGFVGLPPQAVSEHLAEMAKPEGGGLQLFEHPEPADQGGILEAARHGLRHRPATGLAQGRGGIVSMRKGIVLTDAVRSKIDQLAATMQKPTAGKIARRIGQKVGTVNWYLLTRGLLSKKPPTYSLKPYVRNGRTIYPYLPDHDVHLTALRVENKTFEQIATGLTERFGIKRTAHSVQVRAVFLAAVDYEPDRIASPPPITQLSAPQPLQE